MSTIKGYKIDFTTNTLIMNYKFQKSAEVYGSPEYELVQAVKKDYPDIKVFVKSGREQKKPRKNKRLTYKNMGKYIKCFENSDELDEMFTAVKKLSAPMKSPYKYVSDWFISQFPNYRETPDFEGCSKPTLKIVPPPDEKEYQKSNAV